MEMAIPSAGRVLLLGPLQVIRNGSALSQPPSRKVRALLAYLAVAGRPVSREKLCELLWDVADDPRGELRWCLTKLRSLVDGPAAIRLIADRKQVQIEADALDVDALRVAREAPAALSGGATSDLRSLLALFRGDFLEGLSVERAPSFENWLAGQRHRFDQLRQQLLERLSVLLPPEDRIDVLRELIEVAPFDETAHVALVRALTGNAFHAEARQHIDASVKRFQSEGIDPSSLRAAFATAQQQRGKPAKTIRLQSLGVDVPGQQQAVGTRRPTLLVIPLDGTTPEEIADAGRVTSDVIFGIAKLRSVSTIAWSTASALSGQAPAVAAGRVNAQYVADGRLERHGSDYVASIELIEPASGRIFWAGEFSCNVGEAFAAANPLASQIVAGLDAEIHIIERNRSLLLPPISLDAWQAYHRGVANMYRFTSESNRQAQAFFHHAIAHDPTFSRSYAGLSFTHFQNAFVLKTREREQEISLALTTAGQGLEVDPSDPAAHWAMGRALWLRRDREGAITALDRATRLSPSYASAHYSLAMVHCQIGDPVCAVEAADTAALLSPLDPMLFAIFGARTFGLLRLGKAEEAAVFALRGAEQPNAHIHARAIAVLTLATAGRMDEADAEWTRLKHLQPAYTFRQFEDAFHLVDDLRRIYQKAAKAMHIP
ncbi:tetratricopeptide repeat protein [Bradyrhizobium sp. CCBAU 53338]|uniref:tetratricopeptide repeat protein n=1 Tax=Bradyrhizobium sp. CCBAU 53338 TaxID=1325111 RepID=UPI00188A9302|nr:BTAD domain-containing putative transcriptional regulator [Bradyrhizobium sp. CCBAU 53338]QOZ54055.1 transcriptional regulator [Bradyrhizobium sp. CCBAU 53338]